MRVPSIEIATFLDGSNRALVFQVDDPVGAGNFW